MLKVILVLALMPTVAVGIPYLFRVATNSWAWSLVHKDSVTGTWVGTLHSSTANAQASEPTDELGKKIKAEQLARYGPSSDKQKPSSDSVILIQSHLQVFSWLTHVAGTAKTCEVGGKQTDLVFNLGDFKENKLSIFLKNMKNFTDGGGGLDGTLANGVLSVTYRTEDGLLEGTMRKATQQDFDNACASLARSSKP